MKRRDLQGIRGIAVLLVLAFHFKPNSIALGFIGVDMFFVLSGYLMSVILRKKGITTSVVKQFYLRRLKRIVPMFYSIVFMVFLGCYKLLLLPDNEQLIIDLKWAIPFVSNIQPVFDSAGYAVQILSYRFLAHAWSLGIELQFYCIVPLIFGLGQYLGDKSKWFYGAIVMSSLYSQLSSGPKVSYGLPHCRIWQFLSSVVLKDTLFHTDEPIYEPAQKEKNTVSTRYTSTQLPCDISIVLLLVIIVTNPHWMTETKMRVIGTFLTAVLVNVSNPRGASILNHPLLNYFGDISYTLYLVHWPVLVAIKYYLNVNQLSNQYVIFTLACVITLSVLIYHTIEKFLVSSSTTTAVVVSLFCVGAIALWSPFYCPAFFESKSTTFTNEEYTSVIKWNLGGNKKGRYDVTCERDYLAEEWTGLPNHPKRCHTFGKGDLSILVLGNSIGYRAFPLIHDILAGRYRELRLFTKSSQLPLMHIDTNFSRAARVVVDRMRPDLIFHIYAVVDLTNQCYRPLNQTAPDSEFLEMQNCTDYFSARSKRMVIDMPYYMELNTKVAYEVAKRLQKGSTLDDLKIDKKTDDLQQHFHRLRLKSLKCENCVYHHINEAIFEGDYYYFYNRRSLRAYTFEGYHFTSEGLELVRPSYEKIINKTLSELENHK